MTVPSLAVDCPVGLGWLDWWSLLAFDPVLVCLVFGFAVCFGWPRWTLAFGLLDCRPLPSLDFLVGLHLRGVDRSVGLPVCPEVLSVTMLAPLDFGFALGVR